MRRYKTCVFVFSNTNVSHDIHIKEYGLVYSPKNVVLENVLEYAAEYLGLAGVYGVNSPEEVERLMIEREFLAGVVFNHLSVNYKPIPNFQYLNQRNRSDLNIDFIFQLSTEYY